MKKFITLNKKSEAFTNNKSFKKSVKSYVSLIICVAFYLLSAFECQAETKNFDLYKSDLDKVENYLNSIKNLSAKFTQETSDGNLVEGKFFLSRPGKMRVEYLAQPKIVIVVNGSILSYFDVDLDEVSRLSTNTTPASFLTREKISFSAKDVEVTNVKKSKNQIKVSVVKKNRKEAGEFSLIFNLDPLQFVKMEVKNDLDQIIGVTLSDINFTNPIPDKMFVVKKSSN